MNTVAVFGSGHVVEAVSDVAAFLSALAQKGEQILIEETFFSELTQHPGASIALEKMERFAGNAPRKIDYIICFGGDGTFLRTLHRIASPTTPILAINSGHLGFLTDLDVHDAAKYIDRLISGEYLIEERRLLSVEVEGYQAYALNEIAIQKRETGSIINVETHINEYFLADYAADGLIVATPTGSTAYSLSLNGPLISPDCPVLLITPIAPHSLSMRPVVLPDTVTLHLKVFSRSSTFMLVTDGNVAVFPTGTPLTIARAKHPVRLIRLSNHTFADTLREKLHWGQNLR